MGAYGASGWLLVLLVTVCHHTFFPFSFYLFMCVCVFRIMLTYLKWNKILILINLAGANPQPHQQQQQKSVIFFNFTLALRTNWIFFILSFPVTSADLHLAFSVIHDCINWKFSKFFQKYLLSSYCVLASMLGTAGNIILLEEMRYR